MKKILICLVALCAISCENWRARHIGGTIEINVERGYKVTNATFKEGNLWYFVEPMDSAYTPMQKKFVEKSYAGVLEGTIIFNEIR